jgi:hypothetical protein
MDFFNMLCNICGFFFVFNTNFWLLSLNLSENHLNNDKNSPQGLKCLALMNFIPSVVFKCIY